MLRNDLRTIAANLFARILAQRTKYRKPEVAVGWFARSVLAQLERSGAGVRCSRLGANPELAKELKTGPLGTLESGLQAFPQQG